MALRAGLAARRAAPAVLITGLLLTGVSPASAARPKVTLRAERVALTAGKAVELHGRVSSGRRGERVRIVDARGQTRARVTTDASGSYSAMLRPRQSVNVRARWREARSAPVFLKVRPKLRIHLRDVRLFGRAHISGALRPSHPGKRITVRVLRNGQRLLKRLVPLRGVRFAARFRVRRPGSYRAVAFFDDADHLRTTRSSTTRNPPMPSLRLGATSDAVKLVEGRLKRLRYHISGVNRRFDQRTSDALRAFHKVQGRPRGDYVTESTWRALARAHRPRPRARKPGFHIEVDQTKQVLYTVRKGKITNILHTSTGAGGATRDGVFRVWRKLEGYSPGRLYYPSYFDGLRAIHGWPDVPTNAASHGCARVPMWSAKWMYRRVPIGTQVRVYH